MHAAPSGGNQKCAHAFASNVTHTDGVESKCVTWSPACVGTNQMSVQTGVEVCATGPDRCLRVLPCTNDDVGVTIPIRISGYGCAGAKSFACGLARESKKPVTIHS